MFRPTSPLRARPWPALPAIAALGACVSYEAQPIEPARILAALRAEVGDGEGQPATLPGLTLALSRHNEAIVAARMEAERLRAIADAGPNWPTLQLSAGPLLLSGPGIRSSRGQGVIGAIGWALPLSGRTGLQSDLDGARTEAALLDLGSTARREFLGLRRDLVNAVFAAERVVLLERLAAALAARAEAQAVAVTRGRGTALDRVRAELLAARNRGELEAARSAAAAARTRLAERCGALDLGITDRRSLPPLPPALPAEAALLDGLPEAPELVALHGAHSVAEADLRLQVRRQWPDLQVGANYEREQSVDRVGIPLGFQIPLPFANLRNIASAEATRTAAATAYELAVRRRISSCRGALAQLAARREQWQAVRDAFDPRLAALEDLTSRALSGGAADLFVVLQAERDRLEGALYQLDVEAAVYRAWLDLEAAAGAPILAFPISTDDPTAEDAR